MTALEQRLRELHGRFCDNGFMGDPCSIGCGWIEALREAARIGAAEAFSSAEEAVIETLRGEERDLAAAAIRKAAAERGGEL
jgi:hypothetical protein